MFNCSVITSETSDWLEPNGRLREFRTYLSEMSLFLVFNMSSAVLESKTDPPFYSSAKPELVENFYLFDRSGSSLFQIGVGGYKIKKDRGFCFFLFQMDVIYYKIMSRQIHKNNDTINMYIIMKAMKLNISISSVLMHKTTKGSDLNSKDKWR